MVESNHGHQRLRGQCLRVAQHTLLTLTSKGVPTALPKETLLFGPVDASGEFAIMMHDSDRYKCHIDELLLFTAEVSAATGVPS